MSSSTSTTTTDHKKIKNWAESRKGVPATIKGTGDNSGSGVLRIHFPDRSDANENFEEISWDQFFEVFDQNKLALLHSTEKDNAFHKLVSR